MWSFRGSDLVSDANTPGTAFAPWNIQAPTVTSTPYDLTQVSLHSTTQLPDNFVQYRSVEAFWRQAVLRTGGGFEEAQQHEVLLFARSPEEVFETMASKRPLLNDPVSEQIRHDFTSDTWPDSATLIYPPSANWKTSTTGTGPEPIHALESTFDFWQSGATPKNPDGSPTSGFVKAVEVVDHGFCSQFVAYSSILPAIPTQFMSAIEGQLADTVDTSATIDLETSDVVSFLRMPDERDAKPDGGFFFGFDANFSTIGSLLGSVRANAEYWNPYTFKLLDGRLTVDPLRVDSSAGATVNYLGALGPYFGAAFEENLDGALLESLAEPLRPTDTPTSLAGTLWHMADQKQQFPGDPGSPCVPDPNYGEKIKVVGDPTQTGSCSSLFLQIKQNLTTTLMSGHFGNFIGVPLTAFAQLWNDTALASHDGNFYDNFRCAPLVDGGPNQCQYVLRAQRLNVLPSGVEVVFVDGDKEYSNPSFVIWLVLGDDKTIVDGQPILQQMCDPPRAAIQLAGDQFQLGRRAFEDATADNKLFSATNCVPVGNGNYNCQVVVQ